MAYDQILVGQVRCALKDRKDVVGKAMFGGLTFMVSGNTCCGVHRDDLILRLDARNTVEELNNPHARPWDFLPSRPQQASRTTAGSTCGLGGQTSDFPASKSQRRESAAGFHRNVG